MWLDSYRCEEHGEEIDHGLHVEAPLGGHTGSWQEHKAAYGGQQHLGNKGAHLGNVEKCANLPVEGGAAGSAVFEKERRSTSSQDG